MQSLAVVAGVDKNNTLAITSIGSNPGLFSTIMTDPLAYNTTSAPSAAYVGNPEFPQNLPPGARFQETINGPNGAIIDRYVVPQQHSVPVQSVVQEQQQYQVTGQVMEEKTRYIQVPKQIMVPVQETIMVPQVVTKMVPQMTMETQAVNYQVPVQTVQNMVRTVNKVVEGQKFVESQQVIEYERPKVIQGRFLGMSQGQSAEVGVQWTSEYYSGQGQEAPAGPVQYVRQPEQPSVQYVAAPQEYTQQASVQYVAAPTQQAYTSAAVGYTTSPGNFTTQPGSYTGYAASPESYAGGYTSQGGSLGPGYALVTQPVSQRSGAGGYTKQWQDFP